MPCYRWWHPAFYILCFRAFLAKNAERPLNLLLLISFSSLFFKQQTMQNAWVLLPNRVEINRWLVSTNNWLIIPVCVEVKRHSSQPALLAGRFPVINQLPPPAHL